MSMNSRKVNDYVIEIAFVIVLIALFVVALKIFGVWGVVAIILTMIYVGRVVLL